MTGTTLSFLLQVVIISISGVMAPGPVTAATLAAGTRSRHAGALIALGHGIVEFPLMFLIMAGMGALFSSEPVKIGIGLAGGAFLIYMGLAMALGSAKADQPTKAPKASNPIWTGVILTGGNPYFLLWWATVGLNLSTQAMGLGAISFCLFAVVHWTCDLVWLEALSLASFKGSSLFGSGKRRIVLVICGAVIVLFGLSFLWQAARSWYGGGFGVQSP